MIILLLRYKQVKSLFKNIYIDILFLLLSFYLYLLTLLYTSLNNINLKKKILSYL